MTAYAVGTGTLGALFICDNSAYQVAFAGVYVDETTGKFLPPPNPGNSGNGNGKKGGAPGQEKKLQAYLAKLEYLAHRRRRRRVDLDFASFIPAQYLAPGKTGTLGPIERREHLARSDRRRSQLTQSSVLALLPDFLLPPPEPIVWRANIRIVTLS